MTLVAWRRGSQGDQRARLSPPWGRQGARADEVAGAGQECPVDTIAVARKIVEDTA